MSNTIQCPQCNHQFEMTEALLRQVSQQSQAELEQRLKAEREKISREMEQRMKAAQTQASEREKKAIEDALKAQKEGQEHEAQLQKQREFQSQQAADRLAKKLEELQKENQDLAERQRLATIEARQAADAAAQARIDQVTTELQQRLQQESELKIRELELKLGTVQGQLQEASRKASQGSMQNQGAALEATFEDQLRSTFPRDEVTEVKTGVRGADIILEVVNDAGTICGRILFETKRTQAWSNDWVGKLREDIHLAKAHVGVIVTQQLPKEIPSCGFKDGVWVSDYTSAMTLIRSLRWGLMQVQLEKKVHQHADQNAALLYGYVTSPEFRNRVVSIVGAHALLRKGINDEKKAMAKNWKLREAQFDIVEQNIMEMLGSIEGNSGHKLKGVGELELENGQSGLLEDAG
ncbi:MAG: hypothetical protein RLZZ408_1453 [Verrucomicrobiota bacterium]|jgi:hypothetical protein